jgi:hypothetical protein
MIALFGEKKEIDCGLLQENVIEMLMCTYLLRAERYFWVQIIKYENLCKGIKVMEKYNNQHYVSHISKESNRGKLRFNYKRQQTYRV